MFPCLWGAVTIGLGLTQLCILAGHDPRGVDRSRNSQILLLGATGMYWSVFLENVSPSLSFGPVPVLEMYV